MLRDGYGRFDRFDRFDVDLIGRCNWVRLGETGYWMRHDRQIDKRNWITLLASVNLWVTRPNQRPSNQGANREVASTSPPTGNVAGRNVEPLT
jgi:hypothetical protein